MIRGVVVLLTVCGMCLGSLAEAADVPSLPLKHVSKTLKRPVIKVATKTTKIPIFKSAKPKKFAENSPVLDVVEEPQSRSVTIKRQIKVEPTDNSVDMSWVLKPLVATSDGPKKEGSASQVAHIIVTEPGYVSEPGMTIELSGHIVKTAGTTARIDIQIGKIRRVVLWKSEDVQAGKFKLSLDEAMPTGKLPPYFRVSALVFVTKEGKTGAAMVSLEKVVVRVGKVRLAASQ